jgi:hypothetical protein
VVKRSLSSTTNSSIVILRARPHELHCYQKR